MNAVGDKVEVYVDGGIRNGTDVFKALALGAKAVFVGRPILWGLAYKVYRGIVELILYGTIDNLYQKSIKLKKNFHTFYWIKYGLVNLFNIII